MADRLDIALQVIWIMAQIGLGVLFADLMSGIVHWYIVTYGDPDTPVLGKHVYWPTINHHARPLARGRRALSRARRFVPAHVWQARKAFCGQPPVLALA